MSLPPLVEPADELTIDEVRRYSRHLIIPEVGMAGQKRLKNAKVLVIGAGGLGSPALLYLAAAGVGTLGLVDFDTVDFSNLQRQILYSTDDVGRPKLKAATDRLRGLNPALSPRWTARVRSLGAGAAGDQSHSSATATPRAYWSDLDGGRLGGRRHTASVPPH